MNSEECESSSNRTSPMASEIIVSLYTLISVSQDYRNLTDHLMLAIGLGCILQ